MEGRRRAQSAAADAFGALRNAEVERDKLVLRAAKEGNVPLQESLAAHRAVSDAETALAFTRETLTATEAEVNEAQKALDASFGEAHGAVLARAIELRVQAAAQIDAAELALAEAKARYADAGELATLAQLRGARHLNAPILDRGPYGKHPGQHEAAERLAWGKAAA